MADWICVFTSADDFEAEVVRGLLEGSDIQVVVFRHGFKALHPILGHTARGEVELRVPPDQADLARAILSAELIDPDAAAPGEPGDSDPTKGA